MRFNFLPFLVVLLLEYGLAPSYGMELEDVFEDGQQFRREKSPIYLQWSKRVPTSSEGNPSGFQVNSFKTKSKIGLVCTKLDKKRESIDFSSFIIEDTTHSPEVFRTLNGIFKAPKNKNKLPPEIQYLCHTCSIDNKEIIGAAKDAGFMESQLYFLNPSQIYLVKPILPEEPILPQITNDMQLPLAKSQEPVFSKPNSNSLSHPLPRSNVAGAFEVGKKYQSKKYSEIYVQYAAEIDIENVMEVPMKDFGFKVFRTSEKDEVGYVVPNYLPKLGEIRIGAVWINKALRCKGYGSKAIMTLLALCVSKKDYFPGVKNFSFYSTQENKSMLKVAQKIGFVETTSPDSQGLMFLFNGIFFKKPFDTQMSLPISNQTIFPDAKSMSIPESLATPSFATLFQIGETFYSEGGTNPKTYLQPISKINLGYMTEDKTVPGFEIFRTEKNGKTGIGYIVPNYSRSLQWIEIQAIRINEDLRNKHYGFQAMKIFLDIHIDKKKYFPNIQYFYFTTIDKCKAMLKIAKNFGFEEFIPNEELKSKNLKENSLISREISLLQGLGAKFFRKPFNNGK